jgi:hypothetical protein
VSPFISFDFKHLVAKSPIGDNLATIARSAPALPIDAAAQREQAPGDAGAVVIRQNGI